jgi:hypothetical protein
MTVGVCQYADIRVTHRHVCFGPTTVAGCFTLAKGAILGLETAAIAVGVATSREVR